MNYQQFGVQVEKNHRLWLQTVLSNPEFILRHTLSRHNFLRSWNVIILFFVSLSPLQASLQFWFINERVFGNIKVPIISWKFFKIPRRSHFYPLFSSSCTEFWRLYTHKKPVWSLSIPQATPLKPSQDFFSSCTRSTHFCQTQTVSWDSVEYTTKSCELFIWEGINRHAEQNRKAEKRRQMKGIGCTDKTEKGITDKDMQNLYLI